MKLYEAFRDYPNHVYQAKHSEGTPYGIIFPIEFGELRTFDHSLGFDDGDVFSGTSLLKQSTVPRLEIREIMETEWIVLKKYENPMTNPVKPGFIGKKIAE